MLEGKSGLITGGGGGIGRAAALAFAREGANVAVADLVAEAAEETVALVNRAGGQAMSLTGDITNGGLVQDMIGSAPWQVDAGGMKTAE
jgi:NAD(P)-dependent dehydrogenase (short-subunit alcohol dehydrogenase family)